MLLKVNHETAVNLEKVASITVVESDAADLVGDDEGKPNFTLVFFSEHGLPIGRTERIFKKHEDAESTIEKIANNKFPYIDIKELM